MKSKIRISRIMFPKGCYKTQAGDFSIFTAEVIEHMDGDAPKINPTYGTITLKGNVPAITAGDEFVAVYDNEETNNFGTSYDLTMLTKDVDKTNSKQVKEYLKVLCGERIAEELMKLPDPLGMIERKESDALLKVKGIGLKKLDAIYKGMAESLDFSIAFAELMPLGLTKNLIMRICKAYGSATTAVELCKTNPYALAKKVSGVSFLVADDIARKCGLDMNSMERIECAIHYILKENGSNGKTYLLSNQLIHILNDLMQIDFDTVNKCIVKMQQEGTIMLFNEGNEVALRYYFELEQKIAKELKRIAYAESNIEVPDDWRAIVKELEKEQGWQHTDEQTNGIETVLYNNITVVTGKAGSGKSTVTNAMCRVLDAYDISMTCLSAKASQRIAEVTQRPASTIHRLLNLRKMVAGNVNAVQIHTLYADIIIIDESSMVNGELFLLLLKAIKNGAKLIILGDDGQLQSIGDCAVFSDLLKTQKEILPIVKLTKIHRQAQASAIITKSIDVRNQVDLYPKGFEGHTILGELQDLELFIQQEKEGLDRIVVEQFFKEFEKNNGNVMEVQIITPMKNRGLLSTASLNRLIQTRYNPNANIAFGRKEYMTSADVVILEGDKVINTKNNYRTKDINGEEYPVFNGNIGIVTEILEDTIRVDFGGRIVEFRNKERDTLNLAYAITVHSSQGSQWNSVICTFDTT
ncbi:ATP-dependent RecD-like DNA helicase, partial [Romboutsia sp.]|uniref:ATP-dependent RecD-like DNA helicase n=1 Tax=Romboutsia sp. TaxID=1965302 RepID=UPI002BF2C585